MTTHDDGTVRSLALNDLHESLGGKMVPFAGYAMPVQYGDGIKAEHLHTRNAAGLFDVSHMGQIFLQGDGIAEALEKILPIDVAGLEVGDQRYALLLDEQGGIVDDLMVTNAGDHWLLVVNAGCKQGDFDYLRSLLPPSIDARLDDSRALFAIQGPRARMFMAALAPELGELTFMRARSVEIAGVAVWASCSGYTGEDGYELALAASDAERLFQRLLDIDGVKPVGLGARDSLRLEAGLCLYGQDLTTEIDPVTANLKWSISPVRRPGGARAGSYPGAHRIAELWDRPARKRTLLDIEGKAPLRTGVELITAEENVCGVISSGGFGPSVGAPVAMAYVDSDILDSGQAIHASLRGRKVAVSPRAKPYVPQRYVRTLS